MGFLNLFKHRRSSRLTPIPKGSFTVDRQGRVVTSTLPGSFPREQAAELAQSIMAIFQAARKTEAPLTEILIHYSALKLHAREMRGGAIVFLTPLKLT